MKKKLILLNIVVLILAVNALCITRQQILDNTEPYLSLFWFPTIDTARIYDGSGIWIPPTFTDTNLVSQPKAYFQANQFYVGEAYVYGGWDDVASFNSRIDGNFCPGGYNTSLYGFRADGTTNARYYLAGIDCAVFVNRCLQQNFGQGIPGLEKTCLLISKSQMKSSDIIIYDQTTGRHTGITNDGTLDYISQSISTYSPPNLEPKVQDYPWTLDENVTFAYSIFPQFSSMYPPPDTTLDGSKTPEIKVTAKGSISITNVLMWLDGDSVKPSVQGKDTIKTIKYKPDSLSSGLHYVKVQCSNVVNGIAYEDTVAWKFNVLGGIPGFYACSDNAENISGRRVIKPAEALLDTFFVDGPIPNPSDNPAYEETFIETRGEYIWNGTLENVRGLGLIMMNYIHSATPLNSYPGCDHYDPFINYWYLYEYLTDWASIEIEVDGKILPVIYDTTGDPKGPGIANVQWGWDYHTCRDPHNIKITIKPSVFSTTFTCPYCFTQATVIGGFYYFNAFCYSEYLFSILLFKDWDGNRLYFCGNQTSLSQNNSNAEQPNIILTERKNEFILSQNYPNPFIKATSIKYSIKTESDVTLKIYNLQGQLVKTLADERKPGGVYSSFWDGTNNKGEKVSQGVYLYRITAGSFSDTKKLILLR